MKRRSKGEASAESTSQASGDDRKPSRRTGGSAEERDGPAATSGSEAPVAKTPRGRVTVFGAWCKGCGICIEFCPHDVFESGERGAPEIAHEDRCTACGWCVTHCPDMAISVRRLTPEELSELAEPGRLDGMGAPRTGSDT